MGFWEKPDNIFDLQSQVTMNFVRLFFQLSANISNYRLDVFHLKECLYI
jgi:hypothetical protein